jgi:hypothetical protein
LSEQRLARASRTEQQDVRLLELDIVGADLRVDALVVVVNRDGQNLLRALLPDDVLIEDVLDFGGLRKRRRRRERLLALDLLGNDVVTQPDALVADVDRRPCDELFYFLLRLSAERTLKVAVQPRSRQGLGSAHSPRFQVSYLSRFGSMTSSISPYSLACSAER